MERLRVIIVADARRDLLEIRDYIARDNPAAANGLMARFGSAFSLLGAFLALAGAPNGGRGCVGTWCVDT